MSRRARRAGSRATRSRPLVVGRTRSGEATARQRLRRRERRARTSPTGLRPSEIETAAAFTTLDESPAATRAVGFREHLEFFDQDHDEKLSIGEIRSGLERLGFGYLLSVPGAVAIGAGVAGLGLVQGLPVSPIALDLQRTGFVRHPDTEFIDDDGRFDDARLDAEFARFGRAFGGNSVTWTELVPLLFARVLEDSRGEAMKLALLPVGTAALAVEWAALFWVAASTRGDTPVLEKETVRRFYTDARFFDDVAARIAAERASRSRTAGGMMRNLVQQWLL